MPFCSDPVDNLHHIILPAVILGTGLAAVIMRQTRSSMLDVAARPTTSVRREAKGLRRGAVIGRHALRNSLIVVVTIVGLQLGALISGAVVTEQIFGAARLRQDDRRRRLPARLPGDPGRRAVTATAYIVINFAGRPALLA